MVVVAGGPVTPPAPFVPHPASSARAVSILKMVSNRGICRITDLPFMGHRYSHTSSRGQCLYGIANRHGGKQSTSHSEKRARFGRSSNPDCCLSKYIHVTFLVWCALDEHFHFPKCCLTVPGNNPGGKIGNWYRLLDNLKVFIYTLTTEYMFLLYLMVLLFSIFCAESIPVRCTFHYFLSGWYTSSFQERRYIYEGQSTEISF